MTLSRAEFGRQVDDLYRHLYDLVYLRTHPLAEVVIPDPSLRRKERAWQLHDLLRRLTGSVAVSRKIIAMWISICALVGMEFSWLFSPFLARPDIPLPFINPNAFNTNFIEYLLTAVMGGL